MRKAICTDDLVKTKIDNVANLFRKLVCSTMGPEGHNVMLHSESGAPIITKDGVTVSEAITLEDPEENLIADIIKEAANRTNILAGDGTTTSVAIATETIQVINKLTDNYKIDKIRKAILDNRDKIIEKLKEIRTFIPQENKEELKDMLFKIAMISTNGDEEISTCISEAVLAAGIDGLITVKNTYGKAEWEATQGIKIPNARFAHAEFVRGTPDQTLKLKKVKILLTNMELEDAALINVMNESVLRTIREQGMSLLIVAKSGKSFLENMIKFNATGQIKNCIVTPPYFGDVGREMLDDLAAYTGATILDVNKGHTLTALRMEHLGTAKEAVITKEHTTLYDTDIQQDKVQERINLLQEAKEFLHPGMRDDRKIKERLAALSGNVYTLNVPKISNIEDGERLDRVEDAINACKGALEEGYLPGGGIALYYAFRKMESELEKDPFALEIFKSICKISATLIAENALNKESAKEILNELYKRNNDSLTYNFKTHKINDGLTNGVIDSYKVISTAFLNGISIGLTLSTCTGIIANNPEKEVVNPFEFGY